MRIDEFIYTVDTICRKDLSNCVLVSERDYVTQLNALIRYPNGILNNTNTIVHSQTLSGSIEQSIGCDSIMIFKLQGGYKVGLFEAKYPRYPSVNPIIAKYSYDWDSNKRFNIQLTKQENFKRSFPEVVIWEQFFDNGSLGQIKAPFIDDMGSSCILLEDILPHNIGLPKWEYHLLNKALKKGMNIQLLISKIVSCQIGTLISKESEIANSLLLTSVENLAWNNNIDFSIPLLTGNNLPEVNEFMKEHGITNYYYFDNVEISDN